MRTPRVLMIGLLVAATATAMAVVGVALAGSRASGHPVVRREERAVLTARADSATLRALAVLHAWDRRRSAAWAGGDLRALSGLYVPGSAAGRHDRAMLVAYARRGVRMRSMHRQVLAARVRSATPLRIAVLVTDRLVDAVAVAGGVRSALPTGRPETRLVTVRRLDGRWRVVSVVTR